MKNNFHNHIYTRFHVYYVYHNRHPLLFYSRNLFSIIYILIRGPCLVVKEVFYKYEPLL